VNISHLILSGTIFKTSLSVSLSTGDVYVFNTLGWGKPPNAGLQNLTPRNYRHHAKHISIPWTISAWHTSMTDRQMDRQPSDILLVNADPNYTVWPIKMIKWVPYTCT